jgi:tRNA(Leu) C34 or U34 (ribose-2'-O)-methylase TrmL
MTRGFAAIGLHCPKDRHNVGSALRAAGCYEAAFVAYTGNRYRPVGTDTQKFFRHAPLLRVDSIEQAIPYDCVPVAVDLVEGAVPLNDYVHPESAIYIFGPEDGTLGANVLSKCRDRVMIPTRFCLNLGATVNTVLYDRMVKRGPV